MSGVRDGQRANAATFNAAFIAKDVTVTGSYGSPQAIVAGTGLAFTGSDFFNLWFIQGSGGAVDVSASSQIADGSFVGQRLRVISCSATNTVMLENGNNLKLNGPWVGALYSEINLWWDGADWKEESRNEVNT